MIHEPRTRDFRRGYWGHRMHAMTWRSVPPRREWRWFRLPIIHARFSVLVHVQWIEVGDEVLYTALTGDRIADVVGVEWQSGVDDMFKITLENARPYEEADHG